MIQRQLNGCLHKPGILLWKKLASIEQQRAEQTETGSHCWWLTHLLTRPMRSARAFKKRLEKRWFQTDNEISSVRLSVFIAFCHFAGDTDTSFELMTRQAEKDLNRFIKSGVHPAEDAAASRKR